MQGLFQRVVMQIELKLSRDVVVVDGVLLQCRYSRQWTGFVDGHVNQVDKIVMPKILDEVQRVLDLMFAILCDLAIEMVDDLLEVLACNELLVKFPQLMHTYILNTI